MAAVDYRFPLAYQTILPERYREDAAFGERMALFVEYGFSGIELNIAEPARTDPGRLEAFLADHGLRMTMFASGLSARTAGLSLSDPDERKRAEAVRRCREWIGFAGMMRAGIIIGLLQGPPAAEREGPRARFRASLEELVPAAREAGVPLLVEATNRYLTAVANSVEDTAGLIRGLPSDTAKILPDTFHMNIEEKDPHAALREHAAVVPSIHFSDNNRLLPGLGAIDFRRYAETLEEIGFTGTVALEAEHRGDFAAEFRESMRFLAPILRR